MAKVAAKAKDRPVKKKQTAGMRILTILFSIVSVFYVAPVFIVLMNSFKSNAAISRAIFEFPNADSFQGFQSYMTGMFHGNYPFWKSIVWSFFITIGGVVLILFCTSMCAWYLQRSNSRICKIIYYFCIFSMVVPFQMVMFTLSKTADSLKLTTPWGILIIYLGFGAGLAVFMFFRLQSLKQCGFGTTTFSPILFLIWITKLFRFTFSILTAVTVIRTQVLLWRLSF